MAELVYLDFDLSIEASGDRYRARVISSPAGEAEIEFARPFSDLELENFYLRVGRPRQGVRRLDSPEMEAARNFGARLFETAFGDEVYACFRASLNEAQAGDKGLRLRLRVDAPELSSLPWEYLYNLSLDRFLSLSVETPIVRYLDMPQRPRSLTVSPPINVLAMISSPSDFPPLDVEREWRQLKEALGELEGRGLLTLERLERASLAALQHRLRRGDVHIFHYIGHGKFDERARDGLLLFEGESGRGRPLSGAYLGTILHNHRPLRLAVLNACEGARAASADPYSGAAQSLVRQGIPAVVAMQFEITDSAAITFGREFYSAIADGYPVDAALVEARTAIFAQGNDIEWGTPVYFTRAPDGRIFSVEGQPNLGVDRPVAPPSIEPEKPAVARPGTDPELEKSLERAYLDGLTAYHLGDLEAARGHFQVVLSLSPDHQEAADRLEQIDEQIALVGLYERAQKAIQEEDWGNAAQILEEMVERAPGFEDSETLLSEVQDQARLVDLYSQAERLGRDGRWEAVERVIVVIQAIREDYPDPQNLLSKAQTALAEQKQQEEINSLYRASLDALDAEDWDAAVMRLEKLLEADPGYPHTAELLARARAGAEASQAVRPRPKLDRLAGLKNLPSWIWILGLIALVLVVIIGLWGVFGVGGRADADSTQTALALGISHTSTVQDAVADTIEPLTETAVVIMLSRTPLPTATRKPDPTKTPTVQPTDTPVLIPTNASIPTYTYTPKPSLAPGATMASEVDDMTMVYIPEGDFLMGASKSDYNAYSNEVPQHTVYLDAFWIDQTEMTNAKYAMCVDAGICEPPYSTESIERSSYFGNPENDDYPAIYVSWNDAVTYCQWAGRRLPTEAEWEKAARGLDGDAWYPWGGRVIGCHIANYESSCVGGPSNVGNYPNGASPYGVLDMTGNVREWVADWYSNSYYANSPVENPRGPDTGTLRVYRSSVWFDGSINARVTYRLGSDSDVQEAMIDFRCARDP